MERRYHFEVFWKNSLDIINNFLEKGYDVVFNYIINKDDLKKIKNKFSNIEIRFVLLLASDQVLISRDNERDRDSRMGERVLILKENFLKQDFPNQYILDTSNLKIEEIVKKIEENNYIL